MILKSRHNSVFQEGKICVIDTKNIFKQPVYGTIQVELIDKVKSKPFGGTLWRVRDVMDPYAETLTVPEKYLYPDGMSVVRYPINLPQFNNLDTAALDKIIDSLNGKEDSITVSKKDIDRLMALREKIRLSISLTEV